MLLQTLFVQALQLKEGVRRPGVVSGSIDPEVVQAIHRLTHAIDDFDKMGISRRAFSRWEDSVMNGYSWKIGLKKVIMVETRIQLANGCW